jgi:superfamily II DNA or RNA helicase
MELLFHSHLGPTLFQAGDERKAKIIFVQTGTAIDMEERKGVTIDGQVSWPLMTTWLTQNSSRQKWLIEHIRYLMDEGREKILVLSPRVVEIRDLQSEFQGCGVLVGGMMAHKRREALTKRLIFASLQLAKEGLDIPGLNTVVITTTFTHPGMFDQVVGRAFRGENPYVFIPSDNIPEVQRMIKAMKQISRRRGHNVEDWRA